MIKAAIFSIFLITFLNFGSLAQAQAIMNVSSFFGETPDVNEEDELDDELEAEDPPVSGEKPKVIPSSQETRSEVEDDEREVSLDEDEIRDLFSYGVSLGIGSAIPWQVYRLGLHYSSYPDWLYSLYSGYSTFHMRGAYEEKNYDMTAKSRGMMFTSRYFLSGILPMIFVQGGLGYFFWNGDIKPQGADTSGSTTPSSLIRASFNGHGPSMFVGLGLSAVWESGIYLEYTLFSFSYSHPWSLDFEHQDPTIKKIVNKNLKDPMAWGFNNIALGYFF